MYQTIINDSALVIRLCSHYEKMGYKRKADALWHALNEAMRYNGHGEMTYTALGTWEVLNKKERENLAKTRKDRQ